MQKTTTAQTRRYSTGAILLHWLIALCLSFELGLGFAMPRDASGFALFQLHKSVGIAILLLTLLRLGWRMSRHHPPPVENGVTAWLAKAVHTGFYAFMILAPLTGWAVVSTAPIQVPTLIFGTVPLPHLPLSSRVSESVEEAHEILAWIGLALFLLHVAGAARHHLLLHDGILKRMAPAGSNALAIGLAALVVLLGSATWLLGGDSSLEAATEPVRESGLIEIDAPPGSIAAPEPAAPPDRMPEASEVAVSLATDRPEAVGSQSTAETQALEKAGARASAEPGPPPVWTIRPGGRLNFSVANGSGGRIRGGFERWSGTIHFDPDNPESAEIRVEVDLSSASVGDPTQDEMLVGEEFFATASGPTATFRTTSVRRTGAGRYSAQGTLNLRGTRRQQPLTFTLSGEGLQRRVEGAATIDRVAFGIGTGSTGASLGQSVSVTFSFDAAGRRP